jgi:hypothetical protein
MKISPASIVGGHLHRYLGFLYSFAQTISNRPLDSYIWQEPAQ